MGRIYVELDPAGYKYCSEPGIDWLMNGQTLAERLTPQSQDQSAPPLFFNPPGSEWLLPRPRQWTPNWYADARLSQHVVRMNRWTFASGLSPFEWEPTKTGDGTSYPDNQWITVVVPSSFTSLDSTDYTALGTAAGVTLPAGIGTIAFCSQMPDGTLLANTGAMYTPMLQWLSAPPPRDLFVFGFSNLAFILTADTYHVLKNVYGDGSTWTLLGSGTLKAGASAFGEGAQRFTSVLSPTTMTSLVRSILMMDVGEDHLYLFPSEADPKAISLPLAKDGAEYLEEKFPVGSFWIGAAPKQRFAFQLQAVGYEAADSRTLELPLHWDLGSTYKPTAAPQFELAYRMYRQVGTEIVSSTEADGSRKYSNSETGQEIHFGLLNESGLAWTSDGVGHSGQVFFKLTPGNSGLSPGGFLTPQVRVLGVKFPTVLTDRVNSSLLLDDTQFRSVTAESSLLDPLGKTITVDLWDKGVQTLVTSGHDTRDGYPIHVLEDADGDGTPEVLIAAGWVDTPDLEVHQEISATGNPLQYYTLRARGLLTRAEQPWLYLPQLFDPDNPGYVEHTYAVKQALLMAGFDTDDPNVYETHTDPHAGNALAQLPGTWALQSGVIGQQNDSPWAPKWDETQLAYCERLAHDFRGWQFYEGLAGLILYHPDLMLALGGLDGGAAYYVSATLYSSHAAAAAAGVPGQVWEPQRTRQVEKPRANVVRITGKDDKGLVPQVIVRDEASIADINDENFLGEPRVHPEVNRLAVDNGVMRQMAWIRLQQLKRRQIIWNVVTPLAPWQTSPDPIDVGNVIELDGIGPWRIIHLEWSLLKSSATAPVYRTRLTLEKLSSNATAGATAGSYPGAAA